MGTFCDRCGAKVEWHDTAQGGRIALNPEPDSDGTYAFDNRLKVIKVPMRSRARSYRCHWDTCPKKNEPARRRSGFVCNELGCERTDRHFHCHGCGSTDHFIADCPEAA